VPCPSFSNTVCTGDPTSWDSATKWIRNCYENHQNCLTISPFSAKASRLISVGERIDFSDLRLETRPDTGWKHRYVALSHCWGSSLPLKLTQDNLQPFHERIPFDKLTQTFKDAVIATRKLTKDFDVRYLWIDAVCIIQDSNEDWANETAITGDIYQTAFVTFAATFGSDGDVGLFQQRSSLSLSPCTVDAKWSQTNRHFVCEDRRALNSVVENSTLCSRAWVLQERTLSPRVLHFTAQQLFWECLGLDACEAYPTKINETTGNNHFKMFSFETWKYERGMGPHHLEWNNAYLIWAQLVFRYTNSHLTRQSDKLIAIGGLAAKFQAHFGTNDEYLGGLWGTQIPAQLLWKVDRLPSGVDYPAEYRAPSWSWASVDGRIDILRQNSNYDTHYVEVLDHKIEYVKGNVALGVTYGRLRIRGFINVLLGNLGVRSLEDVDRISREPPTFPLEILGKQFSKSHAHLQFDTTGGSFGNHRLCALAVASFDGTMEGLIIRMTMDQRGEYQRCGLFEIRGAGESQAFLDAAKKLPLRHLEYEAVDDTARTYTISMV